MAKQFLGRDEILGKEDRTFDEVPVPEWGGTVRIRSLTGTERDRYESSVMQQRGNRMVPKIENARAKLVAMTIVDGDGKQVFTDADIKALGAKSAAPVERVFDASRKLSGLTEEDMDQLVGNSDADHSGDFSSDSQDS